jgi:hypothetical protein
MEKKTKNKKNSSTISVVANIKNSPKYFTCGEKHEIWPTYLLLIHKTKSIYFRPDMRYKEVILHFLKQDI